MQQWIAPSGGVTVIGICGIINMTVGIIIIIIMMMVVVVNIRSSRRRSRVVVVVMKG